MITKDQLQELKQEKLPEIINIDEELNEAGVISEIGLEDIDEIDSEDIDHPEEIISILVKN